jgi:alpha-tubulin suppressor-like RCC1 family protein
MIFGLVSILLVASGLSGVATIVAANSASASNQIGLTGPLPAGWSYQNNSIPMADAVHGMFATDPITGQAIYFGGYDFPRYPDSAPLTYYSDTWDWTGHNWTKLYPADSPPAMFGAVFTFDQSTRQLVLFGGELPNGALSNETWVWNGSNWIQEHPEVSPPPEVEGQLAVDPSSGNPILFGGAVWVGNLTKWAVSPTNSTWEYLPDDNWVQLNPAQSPPSPDLDADFMATDPQNDGVLLEMSNDVYESNGYMQTWLFHDGNWTQLHPTVQLTNEIGANMVTALNPADYGSVYLFAGQTAPSETLQSSATGCTGFGLVTCTQGASYSINPGGEPVGSTAEWIGYNWINDTSDPGLSSNGFAGGNQEAATDPLTGSIIAVNYFLLQAFGGFKTLSVSTGDANACSINVYGDVQCWGDDGYGQLGDGNFDDPPTEEHVEGMVYGAQQVASGDGFSCAIVQPGAGNKVMCWGDDDHGQLGDGANVNSATPVQVQGLGGSGLTISDLTAGSDFACAQVTGLFGSVKCWGDDSDGQLGNGSTSPYSNVPVTVVNSSQLQHLSAGWNHACGTISGLAYCWGSNSNGQLGDGMDTSSSTPVPVSSSMDFEQLASGDNFSCGLNTGGHAYCWGAGASGQLGDGFTLDLWSPQRVDTNDTYSAISSGIDSTCGFQNGESGNQEVLQTFDCWGGDDAGQLGDTQTGPALTPVAVPGIADSSTAPLQEISVGGYTVCVSSANVNVRCFGSFDHGLVPYEAPQGVSVVPDGTNAATVEWQQDCPDQCVIGYNYGSPDGFEVTTYAAGAEIGYQFFAGNVTSAVISGLQQGTPYQFTVAAVTLAGWGATSPKTAPLTFTSTPSAPFGLGVYQYGDTLGLAWNPPANTGGLAIQRYQVGWSDTTTLVSGSDITVQPSYSILNLTPGDSYIITVDAVNADGYGPETSAYFTLAEPVVAPPGDDNFASASSYIYPDPSGGEVLSNVGATVENGEPDPNGANAGASIWAGYTASANGQLEVNTCGTGFATQLTIFQGTGFGELSILGSDQNSCTSGTGSDVTVSVVGGTTYWIQILGMDVSGVPQEGPINLNFVFATTPDAPSNATATSSAGQATLSWNAPDSDGGSPITGYVVTPILNGVDQTPVTFDSPNLTEVVTDLDASASYTFDVAAVNDVGDSAATETSSPVVIPPWNDSFANAADLPIAQGSAIGSNVGATVENGEPDPSGIAAGATTWASYTPATDGSFEVDTCGTSIPTAIEAYTGNTVTNLTEVSGTSVACGNDAMLTFQMQAGTTYAIQVLGVDVDGSPAEGDIDFSWNFTAAPASPVTVSATSAVDSATVSWTPSSDVTSPTSSYLVTAFPSGATCTAPAGATSCVVTGLESGSDFSYQFTVVAEGKDGTSPTSVPSSPVKVKSAKAPKAPTGLKALAGNSSLRVSWTNVPIKSDGGSPVLRYEITISAGKFIDVVNSASASPADPAIISGLKNGVTYSVTVQAVSADGASAASPAVKVAPSTVPATPTSVKVVLAGDKLSLTWKAPTSNGAAITDYTVTSSLGKTYNTSSTKLSISGLKEPATVNFVVAAKNVDGLGQASLPMNAGPVSVPGVPTHISVTCDGSGNCQLSFRPPSNYGNLPITSYSLEAYAVGYGVQSQYDSSISGTATSDSFTIPSEYVGNTPLQIWIAAVNSQGTGAFGMSATFN